MINIESKVYTVEEVMQVLKIGRNSAYDLMKSPPFPIIKIKNKIRIPIDGFNNWLQNIGA